MSFDKDDLKKQLEYYLSNQNLSQDEFFHDQITKAEGGYLPLHLILKCNKIKKLGVSNETQMIPAVEESLVLELNESRTGVRRRGNPTLPEFTAPKKTKLNDGEAGEPAEKVPNPYDDFEPIVFTLRAAEGVQVTWGQINEALMKQYNISAPYVRYGKTEGNFAMNKARTTPETIEKITTEGVKVGEHVVLTSLCEGTVLAEFWAHHGKHYQGIIKRAKDSFGGKPLKEQKKFGKAGQKAKEIVFHNQKVHIKLKKQINQYKDINQLKNIFKTILARSENAANLKEPYHSMLVELLNFHDKKEKKLNDLKSFTVGTHPDHPETRCFMIVKNDGSQEDFSCIKCIQNMQKEYEN